MSVVCLGEVLIDFVALESGVTVGEASGFQKAPGGGPANVAVAVARLGYASAFLGQVGEDPFGHFLADTLASYAVDVSGLRFYEDARTMLAFVSLTKSGERSFVFYRHPGADMFMRPEDVAYEVIERHKMLHFSSLTLIHEPARSATLAGVSRAAEKNLLISYDPNLRPALWPDAETARQGILEGLNYAHVVKVSDEEVEFLTGGQEVSALWRDATRLIVATHGDQGATFYTRSDQLHVPAFQVATVDTTGAGDGFVAGLLIGILEHEDDYLEHLPQILRFANAVGALATTQRGAIPAMPTRREVEALLNS